MATIRKLSTASTDAQSHPAKLSTRSIKYKEEVRELVREIVAVSNKIKRSPDLYTKEVVDFINRFKEFYRDVSENPAINNQKFVQIMIFLCRVSHFYKDDMVFLVEDLMELLNHHQSTLNPNVRRRVVYSLMILHRKHLIPPFKSIVFLMKLFNCQDKELRKVIFRFIIKDLKDRRKDQQLNLKLQSFMVELLKKSSDNVSKRAIQLLIEMYKRNIWTDAKSVNIIAQGCFNANYKVRLLAAMFLISTTEQQQEPLSSSEDEGDDYIEKKGKNKSVKPSKAREHRVEREKKKAARKQRKKAARMAEMHAKFFPLDLIYSPQDFAERLFAQLRKQEKDKFEVKMATMAVIARMINRNTLIIIPFYSFLQKYMYPTQKDVQRILAYVAESIHALISQEDLEPIMKHLVDNFVNDHCSEQAMTMGLRTVSEIVNKHQHVLDSATLNYLAGYSKYRNKNVSNAAKALINQFRELNPKMLEKKYRGKQWKSKEELDGDDEEQGDDGPRVKDYIEGAELLDEEEKQRNKHHEVPVYLDRVLTDEDFKRIRALQRKRQEEELASRQKLNGDDEYSQEEEEEEEEVDEEMSDISGEDDAESGDEEEEWEDEDEEEEEEEIPKSKNKLKEQNKRRAKGVDELEDEVAQEEDSVLEYYSSSQEDDSDPNPHGFVQADNIARFKKTKAEQKRERREQAANEDKEKKWEYKKKKSELASKTNKEKLKNKPLAMLRPKKNQLKNDMIDLKKKIKDLKNKLGHVRSGKEASKLKKQRIK